MKADAQVPAVAEFFEEEHGRLVGYVRQWLDEAADEDAEDIVQDVALNIFNRGDVTAPIRNLSAYVYRALKNRMVDYLRRKKAVLSLDEPRGGESAPTLADLLQDEMDAPPADLEKKERRGLLYQALDALRPEDRAVIIATDFEGRAFQDLAEDWDIPLGTLLARKARALKKIRKHLEASGKSR